MWLWTKNIQDGNRAGHKKKNVANIGLCEDFLTCRVFKQTHTCNLWFWAPFLLWHLERDAELQALNRTGIPPTTFPKICRSCSINKFKDQRVSLYTIWMAVQSPLTRYCLPGLILSFSLWSHLNVVNKIPNFFSGYPVFSTNNRHKCLYSQME